MSNAQGDRFTTWCVTTRAVPDNRLVPIRNSLAKRGDMEHFPQLCIIVHHPRARQDTELRGRILVPSLFPAVRYHFCFEPLTQQALRF
jgi:hypothetical protein